MKEGQPSYDQLCKVIGSIYADAYLRIEFLERENKQLREDQQKTVASLMASMDNLREERDKLKEGQKEWNNGNGNFILPESWQEKLTSKSKVSGCSSYPPIENSDSSPVKFTEMREGTPN